MTKAEVERYIDGAVWRIKQQAQFDYCLADLIGLSVGRLFNKNNSYPAIEEVYPTLFKKEIEESQQEEDITMKSINNFLQFANQHNKHMKGVEM